MFNISFLIPKVSEKIILEHNFSCLKENRFEEIPVWFRWFIKNSNIGVAYKDHERQENELKTSKLDWTIVRPTGLTNFKKEKKIIESYNNEPKPKLTISRKNVAKFMVNALKRDELIGQITVISE